jgi:hypothetical protein
MLFSLQHPVNPLVLQSPSPSNIIRCAAFLVLVFVWALTPTSAAAQYDDPRPESYTNGLYVNGMTGLSTISYDGSDGVDPGLLFSGRIGYGFTDLFGLFIEFGLGGYGSTQDVSETIHPEDYGAGFFDLGAQFNFRSGKVWVPYAEVALNGFATADDSENGLSGGGFTIGGGLKYYVTDAWALNGRVQLGGHALDTVEIGGEQTNDVDLEASTTRFSFGLTWYVLR